MNIIHFSANFSGIKIREEIQNPSHEQARKLLETTHNVISGEIYNFAPINKTGIEKFIEKTFSNISDLKTFKEAISQIKPKKLEEELKQFTSPKTFEDQEAKNLDRQKGATEIAFNYCLMLALNKAFSFETVKRNDKLDKKELRFVANLEVEENGEKEQWTIIKKANLENATNGEVMGVLIGVANSVNGKLPLFIKNQKFLELQNKYVPQEAGRSFGKLISALEQIDENEFYELDEPILNRLLIINLFNAFGFNPFNSIDTFNTAFPELKIPKPKGNFGKKKKK